MTISVMLLTRSVSGVNAISYMRGTGPLAYLAEGPDFAIEAVGVREALEAGQEEVDRELLNRDICVFNRIFGENGPHEVVDLAHSFGSTVIFDCDDDLSGRTREWWGDAAFREMLGLADFVTVSTKPLAKTLGDLCKRKPIVLPDTIDFPWYSEASLKAEREIPPEYLTIGLVGTATHEGDWLPAVEALYKLTDKYQHVLPVVACGYLPPYMKELPRKAEIRETAYYAYPALMRQVDILCCCLDPDDPFNVTKAPIKALEAMAACRDLGDGRIGGAVPVCTDMVPYREVVDGRTGMLVDNDQWYEVLEELVTNQEWRTRLASNGPAYVEKHHDMSKEYVRWGRAYRRILRTSKQGG